MSWAGRVESFLDLDSVVVTAHPDDESLWCAGLMLRYPGRWTVICCSIPYRDVVRAWRFHDACEVLGAVGRVMPWQEKRNAPLECLDHLDLERFDLIVTHNAAGEYGHPAHIGINAHITAKWAHKKIITIGYRRDGSGELQLPLSDKEWEMKQKAIGCYRDTMTFRGREMKTGDALLEEYGAMFDLRTESFDD